MMQIITESKSTLCQIQNILYKMLLWHQFPPLIRYHSEKQEKDYALLLSFVGQARLRFAGVHSLFLAFWCTMIEIDNVTERFTFLAPHVSAIPWYSLLQMLFFRPMYLHLSLFMTCRCFSACLSCTIASTSCLFWDLRILPSQIFHLHPTFSMICRCFSSKFCIFNLRKSIIADIFTKIISTTPAKQSLAL